MTNTLRLFFTNTFRPLKLNIIAALLVLTSTSGVAASMPSGGAGGPQGTFAGQTIVVNGVTRSYRMVVPKNVTSAKAAPLLFAFHGLYDNQYLMPLYTFLDLLAAEQGFIVVYPDALNGVWSMAGGTYAAPDVAFFDAMYAKIGASYNVDLNGVYLTGMSMGAYFTNILAAERADKIAAIMVHSGTLGLFAFLPINVTHKYAVMVVQGASDPVVNVSEGVKTRDLYTKWGHPAQYFQVPNWGHFWAYPIDVNHKMWSFFMAHPR